MSDGPKWQEVEWEIAAVAKLGRRPVAVTYLDAGLRES
jgi:hypothetical protein